MSKLYTNSTYKTNLTLIEYLIGNGITTGSVLSKLAKLLFGSKFKGIYDWKRKIPKIGIGECVIVNKKTNEHWIGVANVKGTMYCYDSFNRKEYIGNYASGDTDDKPDQTISEIDCGGRTLAWLVSALS